MLFEYSVLALLPLSAGFMLGLPMGIWALFVLNRADAQQTFAVGKKRRRDKAGRQPGMLFGIRIEDHLKIVTYIRIGIGGLFLVPAVVVFLIFVIPGIASGNHKDIAILAAFGVATALLPLARLTCPRVARITPVFATVSPSSVTSPPSEAEINP